MRKLGRSPIVLWLAFIAAHLWLGCLNLYAPGLPLGDVSIVYKFWTDQIHLAGFWVGIQSSWVYPILAIFPMLAASVFGSSLYANTWLSMILLLDLVAFGFLIGWRESRGRVLAAWWWTAFLVLLGPISLGRIDAVTVALAVTAIAVLATRPAISVALLTVAMWVKVWPIAILLSMVTAVRGRIRAISIILGLSLVIVVTALSFGSGSNVFSFISQQTNRGLQVEAPISTVWLWLAFMGVPNTSVYYDREILTWQVTGDGVGVAGTVMTPLMLIVAIGVLLIAVLAIRRGADSQIVFATVSIAIVACLIAFNKVGSPQFVCWLAVPVILGLSTKNPDDRGWFTVPATLSLAIATLTQLIYPYLYGWLLSLNPLMLGVLTLRNGLYFVLIGWAVNELLRMVRESEPSRLVSLEQDSILDRSLS
ncbi:MAG: DUF2029 domain-containing protein [Cryobacterium sp.]|nr:DUF2029 domain-containing protein [Cryobacterium sp.]